MTMPTCCVAGCGAPPTREQGMCALHERGFRLTTRIADAVREFLDDRHREHIAPGCGHDDEISDAGELLAESVELLLTALFDGQGRVIAIEDSVITARTRSTDTQSLHWSVAFPWRFVA